MPTCLACIRAHVLTCFVCLRAHVPTCLECLRALHVNMFCVLIYSRVNVACDLTCSHANKPWEPYLTRFAWPLDHLPTYFDFSVSSFDGIFSVLLLLFLNFYILLVRFKSLIKSFSSVTWIPSRWLLTNYWDVLVSYVSRGFYLGGLQNFGKKTGKMYNVYWYRSFTHIFLSRFFIFTSNTMPLKLLMKAILVRNCKSVKGH